MERRRLLDLPSEYTRLNYIESTGTQYINSELPASQCDMFVLDTMIMEEVIYPDHPQYNCVGSSTSASSGSSGAKNFIIRNDVTSARNSKKAMIGYNGSWLTVGAYALNILQRYTLKIVLKYAEQKLYVNGNLAISYTITSSPTNVYPLYIFHTNYGGKPVQNNALTYRGRIYSLTMSYNNNYMREFIPSKRIADNVVGMYDLCGSICQLTGTPFYINAGSGTFIGG